MLFAFLISSSTFAMSAALIHLEFLFFLLVIVAPSVPQFLINSSKNLFQFSQFKSSEAIVLTSAERWECIPQTEQVMWMSTHLELIPVILSCSALVLLPQSGHR